MVTAQGDLLPDETSEREDRFAPDFGPSASLSDLDDGEDYSGGRNVPSTGPGLARQLLKEKEASAAKEGAPATKTRRQWVARKKGTGWLSEPWKAFKSAKGGKKWLIIGGAAFGSLGVFGIAILLLLFITLFQVPTLAHDVTSYESASFGRQFYDQANRTMDQALSVESASDGSLAGETPGKLTQVWQGLKAKFHDNVVDPITGKLEPVAKVWDKVNSVNPNQILKTLSKSSDQGGHGLKIVTKRSAFGREVLQSVELDGKVYEVTQAKGLSSWLPVLSDIKVAQNNEAFWAKFKPVLMDAVGMGDSKIGTVVRSATSIVFRQKAGLTIGGWILDKFTAKNANPDVVNSQEEQAVVNNANPAESNTTTELVKDGEEAVKEGDRIAAEDAKQTAANLAKGGVNQTTLDKLLAATNTVGDKVLSFANPIYGIAVPICILYDGSVIQSGPPIDTNSRRLEESYLDFNAKGDQLKSGAAVDSNNKNALLLANGAAVKQLGPVSDYIQYMPSYGGTGTTAGGISPQAGASGGTYYNIFNALGVDANSSVGTAITYILGGTDQSSLNLCGVLTNTGVAIGITLANVVVALVTLGSSEAAAETAGEASEQAVKFTIENLIKNLVTATLGPKVIQEGASKTIELTLANRILSFAFGKVPSFLFKQGVIIGGISLGAFGINEFTRIIAANRAGEFTAGNAQGSEYARNIAVGGNLYWQDTARTANFARPLLPGEVSARDDADKQYLADQVRAESFTDRYLALSSPDSLVTHLAMSMASMIRPDFFANLLGSFGSILVSPFTSLGVAQAAPDPTAEHFGNVQFGWSEAEEKLINSDTSYLPLENQSILDKSGRENDIAQRYAKCFGYTYNPDGDGSLDPTDTNGNMVIDPTGDGSMGNLLAHHDIARDDKTGALVDDSSSDCSPTNLGVKNPNFGDLVFRWRLAMWYDVTLDTMTNLQTVSSAN